MRYIKRQLEKEIKTLAKEFPVVALLGPRQSGKSTLVKHIFSQYQYVSLEDLSMRELAQNDPLSFLEKFARRTVIDEIQYAPQLFSYLQLAVDKNNTPGQYIITGSQNYLLLSNVSQSLAGRVGIAKLLPFSFKEIQAKLKNKNTEEIMITGFYPRIFDQNIRPTSFYNTYISTYLEKDAVNIFKIKHLEKFRGFLKLLASRSGQLLNINSLAADLQISRLTANEWLNVLEISFVVFRLPAFFKNYKKQTVKTKKIFFYDTGLLCHLLGIESARQVASNYLLGNIFENLVIAEFLKNNFHQGRNKQIYYWRDNKGREVDLVVEDKARVFGYEIKKTQTVRNDILKNLFFWQKLSQQNIAALIYDGPRQYTFQGIKIINWRNLS